MSLRGFVELELARRCPDLVLGLFCTGCAPFSGLGRLIMSQPRLLGGIGIVLSKHATNAMFWLSTGVEPLPGLRHELKKNQSMALLKVGHSEASDELEGSH